MIYRQVYLLACRHLRCPEVFTCEIEKDDIADPFDETESFQLCLIGVWILPTLDWLYSTYRSLKALSLHKFERTCEFEKDDNIDPFDKSNPFNRFQLVSGYSQPWIGFILKKCQMDNVYSIRRWLKALSVHKVNVPVGFDKDDIINLYDKYLVVTILAIFKEFHLDDIVAH